MIAKQFFRKQETGNRKQETGNRKQETGKQENRKTGHLYIAVSFTARCIVDGYSATLENLYNGLFHYTLYKCFYYIHNSSLKYTNAFRRLYI
jgi:hypothetical protein